MKLKFMPEFGQVQLTERTNKGKLFAFLGLIVVFIILLIVRDIGGFAISKYVFIGIAFLVFLFFDQTLIIAFLTFITPISLGVSYTYMTFLALFFIFFKSKTINIGKAILFPFMIIFIEIVNSFFSTADTIPEFLRSIVIIVLLTLLFLDKSKEYNYQFVLKMYLFGFVVLTFFTVYWITKSGPIEQFLQTGTTLRFSLVEGVEGNIIFAASNMMGLYAVMTIAIALLLIFVRQGNRLLLTLMVLLGFVMGFISTSRGFVFSVILCIVLYILFSAKSLKSLVKAIAVLTILSLLIILLVNTLLSGAYTTFSHKMNMADFSNGRMALLQYYHKVFISDLKIFFFGVGIQNYVAKCGSPVNSIHNAIQEVLIAWGITGLFCVVGFFAALYQNAVRQIARKKRELVYLIPALVYLFYVQFNQLFSVRSMTIMIIVIYCAIALNSQKQSQKISS